MIPGWRSTATLALLLCMLGCRLGERRIEEAYQAALRRADAAWDARGRDGFEPVADALADAEALRAGRAETRWRLTRLEVGQGLAAEDDIEAMRHFASGRVAGVDCLASAGSFDLRERERVGFVGLDGMSASARPCVDWTALAWSQWIARFGGAAAAVDLARIDQLVTWASTRPMEARGPHSGIALWAEGMLYAARPSVEGRDMERAARTLEQAIALRPSAMSIRADLVLWVALPTEDHETVARQVRRVTSLQANAPEDQRAQQRLAHLRERVEP